MRKRTPGRPPARGFTLVETAVSLFILSLMLAALTSAVFFVARAIPGGDDPASAAPDMLRTLEQIDEDLSLATLYIAAGSNDVELSTADRDGDGSEENVHYRWAGKGQPLTRSLNGAAFEAVSPALEACVFGFDSVPLRNDGPVESDVVILAEGGNDSSDAGTLSSSLVNWAQPFDATVGDGAASWTVESVWLDLWLGVGVSTDAGTLELTIYQAADDGSPEGDALGKASMSTGRLSDTEQRIEFAFDNPPSLAAGQTAVIVIAGDDDKVRFKTSWPGSDDNKMLGEAVVSPGDWVMSAVTAVFGVSGRTSSQPPVNNGYARIEIELTPVSGVPVRFASAPLAPVPSVE